MDTHAPSRRICEWATYLAPGQKIKQDVKELTRDDHQARSNSTWGRRRGGARKPAHPEETPRAREVMHDLDPETGLLAGRGESDERSWLRRRAGIIGSRAKMGETLQRFCRTRPSSESRSTGATDRPRGVRRVGLGRGGRRPLTDRANAFIHFTPMIASMQRSCGLRGCRTPGDSREDAWHRPGTRKTLRFLSGPELYEYRMRAPP